MYFEDREQAGQMLANDLCQLYSKDECIVVAMNDEAVLVGKPIAERLNCPLVMLMMDNIAVPGEDVDFGGMAGSGDFTYNSDLTQGEIDDYASEYHSYFDEQKREVFQKLNEMMKQDSVLDSKMFHGRVVILVAESLKTGTSLNIAVNFLKPIHIKRIVAASPVSTVQASDKAHLLCDDVHILDIKPNYMGAKHYYSQNNIPPHEQLVAMVSENLKKWI